MVKQRTGTGSDAFEKKLAYNSQVYAFIAPIGALVACVTVQLFFTDYFGDRALLTIPILFCVVGLLLARGLWRSPGRKRLAVEYSLVTALGIFAFNYLLPFPSPYIMAGAIFAIVIYFDFGAEWAILSLALQYGIIIIHALHNLLPLDQFMSVVALVVGPSALAILVIRLQALSRQEIASIKTNSHKALENEQQIQSLINNISDGVIAVDQKMHVIMYNAAALDVLDLNINIHGKNISKYLKPIDAQNQPVSLSNLLANTKTQINNRDLRITYSDGSTANLYLGIAPIYLGYGKAVNNGFTLVVRDITREKSLEDERNEFISVVSHELRTPIAITEGNISNAEFVAEKSGDIAAIQKALKESHSQVLFLADMINDLSTLSRAERGVIKIDVETINVTELANELLANYTPQAEAKGLVVRLKLDPKAEVLQSSKLYSREILQNFITNAIKYTDEGSVTIQTTADPKGIRFSIKDTGIGISKGDQQKVFDKFFRSEDYRTRKANGTGLGLYVTLKLTHMIHADIDVKSELNKGSTFTIFMPNLA